MCKTVLLLVLVRRQSPQLSPRHAGVGAGGVALAQGSLCPSAEARPLMARGGRSGDLDRRFICSNFPEQLLQDLAVFLGRCAPSSLLICEEF